MKHSIKNALLAIATVVAITLSASQADAAGYLKIGDIQGESTDSDHRSWSDALSFSHKMSQGTARGSTTIEPLTVRKRIDKSSPLLQQMLLRGEVARSVEFELTREIDGKEVVYLRYELKNVLVSSYSVSGSGSAAGDPLPTEEFTLNFEEIKVTYTSPKGEVTEYSHTVEAGSAT